jgi:hypothetical protein
MDRMADGKPRLTGKQAVDAAFAQFHSFFGDDVDALMLEGIELLDVEGQWKVVLGFDAGRLRRTRRGAAVVPRGITLEPIRESRTFFLRADDGSLVRMT